MAMAIKKLHAGDTELAEITRNSLFITSASYEERCLTVPKAVADSPKKVIVFWVKNLFPQIEVNLGEIEKCIGSEKVCKVATDISNPVASASEIDQAIKMGLEGEDGADVAKLPDALTWCSLMQAIDTKMLRPNANGLKRRVLR